MKIKYDNTYFGTVMNESKTKSKLSGVNYNGGSGALHESMLCKSLSRSCPDFKETLSTLTKVDKL